MFFEGNGIRAVHPTWDASHIELLKGKLQDNCLTDDLIYESVRKGTEFHKAIEDTLKGKELSLPENVPPFKDKDGAYRREFKVKWWEDFSSSTYRDLSIEYIEGLPERPVGNNGQGWHCPHDELPVFFGHYWLNGTPRLFRGNIFCVDYSVARNGYLTAYRYDGEDTLGNEGFVYV